MAIFTIRAKDGFTVADIKRKLDAFTELYGEAHVTVRGRTILTRNSKDNNVKIEEAFVSNGRGVDVTYVGRQWMTIKVDGEFCFVNMNERHGIEEVTFISKVP